MNETQFNFRRPDGSYGTAWTADKAKVQTAMTATSAAIRAAGVVDVELTMLQRVVRTEISDEVVIDSLVVK